MMQKLQQYAKAIVTLVGAILTAGVFVLPDEIQGYVGLGIALLTTFATYRIPNAPSGKDVLVAGDGLGGGEHVDPS